MDNNIQDLIDISRKFGRNKDYIIAGGGNTSFKDDKKIWVKASGTSMADIDENGFVCLDREKLKVLSTNNYSKNPSEREEQVKNDLANAILYPEDKRPSVETSMHEIIQFPFVVHTHPTLVNGLLCAKNSKELVSKYFGDDVLYIEYIDPGYTLFKAVENALIDFRIKKNREPSIIFLENHGVFVGAKTVEEINSLYHEIEKTLTGHISSYLNIFENREDTNLLSATCLIAGHYETKKLKSIPFANELADQFVKNIDSFGKVKIPFTPDNIVYCKSNYLFIKDTSEIIFDMINFKHQYDYFPKIVALEGHGLIAFDENKKSAQIVLDVFVDMMKVSYLTENFGGPRPMSKSQIKFIDNWEVENYRRMISKKA